MRRMLVALGLALVLPAALLAAPRGAAPPPPAPAPGAVPPMLQRVVPAVVGVKVEVPTDRASVPNLGHRRWGSGVIFDEAGYLVTVSYVLLDAGTVEVTLGDGRRVPARLAAAEVGPREACVGTLPALFTPSKRCYISRGPAPVPPAEEEPDGTTLRVSNGSM